MDLWVLPPPNQSKWFARLDWYLNWQMCKGLAFERARPAVELYRVIEDTDFPFEITPRSAPTPLLVISAGRLPTAKCLVLEPTGTLKEWLSEVQTLAAKLEARKMRVFLPRGTETAEADSLWKTLPDGGVEVQFSSDEDAL